MELLKGLSPVAVDSEFRNMAPDAGGSVEWLEYFMEFLLDQLKTNKIMNWFSHTLDYF